MAAYTVQFKPSAAASLRKLPHEIRRRIMVKANALAHDQRPPGSRKIVGQDLWRLRVGDYRVIYRIEDAILTVTVVKVGHRGHGIYENLDVL